MKVITVACQKGGVAKTTTAITLGHGLAIKGKRVLLVDFDPQGQCATALGRRQAGCIFDWFVDDAPLSDVTRSTGRADLFLIPGNNRTAWAETMMTSHKDLDREVLKRRKEIERAGLDYVIIDTAPSVGHMQRAALLTADLVIIPTATDYLASEGVVRTYATLKELRTDKGWRGKVLGILPTFYDETTKESKATLADLRKSFGKDMVLAPIHRATILRECASEGVTIWERDPKHRAAQEYADLLWRLING